MGDWLTEEELVIAEANGINRRAAKDRYYYKGYTREDAITKPMKGWGINAENIRIAAENGIGRGTLNNRLYNLQWPVERAITEPVKSPDKYNWNEWKETAAAHGVSRYTYTERRRRGWGAEKAATDPVKSEHTPGPRNR